MKTYQNQRNQLISQLQSLDQQMTALTEQIRAVKTVEEKLQCFDQRDTVMQQQTELQLALVRLDQQHIEELNSTASQPRFQPGAI